MTDFKFNDMQIEFAMLAVSVEFSGLPIVFVFCRFVFRLISTFERSMIRVETHFRYQFSLFLENSIIYHSNYSCSLTRVSLISLVALVPCRPTPFSLVLTQLNLVQSFSSVLVNNVIPKGVFGLAALFYDCKLNLKFCWSSGNAFVSGAGGLRFKSQAGQIGHSVANGSPPLRHFFERSCVARAQ